MPEFAVKLAGILILTLAMPFGEFVAWSAPAKAHHGSFHPADPRFNDVVPCLWMTVWSSNLWWACPALTPHLPSLYHSCLKATCKDNREVRKLRNKACIMLEVESEDPQEKERRWEDFWELCQVAAGGPTADELRSGV